MNNLKKLIYEAGELGEEISIRLEKIRAEKRRLHEICVPYKVEPAGQNGTPYFDREEVVDSLIDYWVLSEKEKQLRRVY